MDWIQIILSVLALITFLFYHEYVKDKIRYLENKLDIEKEYSYRIKSSLKELLEELTKIKKLKQQSKEKYYDIINKH